MGPCPFEITMDSAFVFPLTFFQAVSSRLRPTVPQATLDWHILFDVGFLSPPLKKLENPYSGIGLPWIREIWVSFHDFHDIIFFIESLRGDDREESKWHEQEEFHGATEVLTGTFYLWSSLSDVTVSSHLACNIYILHLQYPVWCRLHYFKY